MTLQAVGKYGAGKAKIAENEKTVIDWEHWEAAIDDPVVGEMKAVYEDLMKNAETELLPKYEKDQQELLAKLNEQFEGAVRPASPSAPADHAAYLVPQSVLIDRLVPALEEWQAPFPCQNAQFTWLPR